MEVFFNRFYITGTETIFYTVLGVVLVIIVTCFIFGYVETKNK